MSNRMLAGPWALAGAAVLALTLAACSGSSSPAADGARTTTTTTTTVVHAKSLDTGFESGTTEGLTDSEHAEVTRDSAKTGSQQLVLLAVSLAEPAK